MLVIFGYGHRTVKENELRKAFHCYHCNNTTRWKVSKETTWFSLFFIPVIPVKSEYWKYCPICRNGQKITRPEYESIINQAI